MRKHQSGFTLIELIIVIVILGILAVTAAPKFLDVTDQANAAATSGIEGNVAASANVVRASWLLAGSTGTTTTIDGEDITVEIADPATTANGYPIPSALGIGRSIDISSSWSQGDGKDSVAATGYIFAATDIFPTNGDNDGIDCVIYSLDATTNKPITKNGEFVFVSTGNSTCA
jgi:MSHA pilin protein MshA